MKIQKVSCTQFAGLNNRTVTFQDGINLIYGKNESGKSTLVNLISRTLFQHSKLNARTDKDFISLYLPAEKRNCAFSGDFADGCITLSSGGKEYTVFKEWGKQSACRLTTPDGIFKDEDTVDSILKKVLGYGEGIYADLLFSSRRNTDISLESVLDAKSDTDAKRELVAAVTKAFSQSDGISIDAIERAIKEKTEEIAGKHWDRERNMPQRKAGRWANGVGEILKAYYALEDAGMLADELISLEAECDRASSEYASISKSVREAEESENRLNSFAAAVSVFGERKRRLKILETQLEKYRAAAAKWPVVSAEYEKGVILQKEQENRAITDRYGKAKTIHHELKQYRLVLASSPSVSQDDINEARALLRKTDTLKNRLCAMNISAKIKMLGENTVEITTVGTGEKIVAEEEIQLNQAVTVTVPGVMQMQLAPADIDTEQISRLLNECNRRIDELFKKHSVKNIDELEEKARYLLSVQQKVKNAESELRVLLKEESFEDLEKRAISTETTARTAEEIGTDILKLTGGTDIIRFVAVTQAAAEAFASEFETVESLDKRIGETSAEISKVRTQLESANDIPDEYLKIEDIDEHCKAERENLKILRQRCEEALRKKTEAVQHLEDLKEKYGEDIQDRLDKATADFENQKTLLSLWNHILEVFYDCKKRIHENPTEDLAESFSNYLSVLTDEKISSDFPESDRLEMRVFSSDSLLCFRQLSEGTKQTVSLAFRLAVLDRLFPDGGVIVLDDPFSDMDAERKSKACKLIEVCAKRHQVIFLTCHREYESFFNMKAQDISH